MEVYRYNQVNNQFISCLQTFKKTQSSWKYLTKNCPTFQILINWDFPKKKSHPILSSFPLIFLSCVLLFDFLGYIKY